MLIAFYWIASFVVLNACIFLILYRAYGRGWNDHAQRRAEAEKRALAKRPIPAGPTLPPSPSQAIP